MNRGALAGAGVGALSGALLWYLLTAHSFLGALAWVVPLALAYAAVGASFGRGDQAKAVAPVAAHGVTVLPGHPLPTRTSSLVPRPRQTAQMG